MMPSMNFEPPSDFVEDGGGGGGGKKKFLKIAGLGCAGIFVLFAILTAAGAFKAVSCCGDAVNVSQKTELATVSAMQFAAQVSTQSYDAAHKSFSATLQQKTSATQLKAMFTPHEAMLKGSVPMLVKAEPVLPKGQEENLNALKTITQWRFELRFYPNAPTTTKKVLHISLLANVVGDVEEGKQAPKVTFDSIGMQVRDLKIEEEQAAKSIKRLHNTLQLEGAQGAYRMMSQSFRQATDGAAFETFISQQGDLFTASTFKLLNVEYFTPIKGRGYASRVTGRLQSKSGKVALVTYDLVQQFNSWRITAISPVISSTAVVPDASPTPTAPAKTKTPENDAPKTPEGDKK